MLVPPRQASGPAAGPIPCLPATPVVRRQYWTGSATGSTRYRHAGSAPGYRCGAVTLPGARAPYWFPRPPLLRRRSWRPPGEVSRFLPAVTPQEPATTRISLCLRVFAGFPPPRSCNRRTPQEPSRPHLPGLAFWATVRATTGSEAAAGKPRPRILLPILIADHSRDRLYSTQRANSTMSCRRRKTSSLGYRCEPASQAAQCSACQDCEARFDWLWVSGADVHPKARCGRYRG